LSLAVFGRELRQLPVRAVQSLGPGISVAAFERHLTETPKAVALAGEAASSAATVTRLFSPIDASGRLMVAALLDEECWIYQIEVDARGYAAFAFFEHLASMPFDDGASARARLWVTERLNAGLERWPGESRFDTKLAGVDYSLRGSFNSTGTHATLVMRAASEVDYQRAIAEAVACE
jgi:hypothetical protein